MRQIWRVRKVGAASWQNQQNECAPSKDSDQPGHPPSLIRVFAVCMKKAWVLSYPRLICLRWAHSHFVGFVMRRFKCLTNGHITLFENCYTTTIPKDCQDLGTQMKWDEMRWDEMRWDEMRQDEMRCYYYKTQPPNTFKEIQRQNDKRLKREAKQFVSQRRMKLSNKQCI